MKNFVDTYKSLTKLEKEVYDNFHKDILLSGNGISGIGVFSQ